jgi:hypothetical protein
MAKVEDTGFRSGPRQSNGGQVVIEGGRRPDPDGNRLPDGSLGGGRVVPRPAGFPGSPADSPRDTR